MRIKVCNVTNNRSTNEFVILSERSESKDLLRSPSSTVNLPERSFDCALRAPLRMTYDPMIPGFTVFQLLIHIMNEIGRICKKGCGRSRIQIAYRATKPTFL